MGALGVMGETADFLGSTLPPFYENLRTDVETATGFLVLLTNFELCFEGAWSQCLFLLFLVYGIGRNIVSLFP